MPSKRRQVNVRVDEETEQRIHRLLPLVKDALGLDVSMSDLVRLGMIELERKYAPPGDGDLPADRQAPPAKGRGQRKGK